MKSLDEAEEDLKEAMKDPTGEEYKELVLHEWALALLIICVICSIVTGLFFCFWDQICSSGSGGNANAIKTSASSANAIKTSTSVTNVSHAKSSVSHAKTSDTSASNANASNDVYASRKSGDRTTTTTKSGELSGVIVDARKSANKTDNRKSVASIGGSGAASRQSAASIGVRSGAASRQSTASIGANGIKSGAASRQSIKKPKSSRSNDERGAYKQLPLIGKRSEDSSGSETGS